jgi:hypothetical protein
MTDKKRDRLQNGDAERRSNRPLIDDRRDHRFAFTDEEIEALNQAVTEWVRTASIRGKRF